MPCSHSTTPSSFRAFGEFGSRAIRFRRARRRPSSNTQRRRGLNRAGCLVRHAVARKNPTANRRLLGKPTLFRERPAHGAVDFRPSHPEAGLRQILPYSLPTWRLSARNVDVVQYEGPDVIERLEHAFAARGAYNHPDRLKTKFSHKMQTPGRVFGATSNSVIRSISTPPETRKSRVRTLTCCGQIHRKTRRWV